MHTCLLFLVISSFQISDESVSHGIATSTPSSKVANFFSCSVDDQPSPIHAPAICTTPTTLSTKPNSPKAPSKSVKPVGASNLMLKRRQRKLTKHVNPEEPICVETYKCSKPDKLSQQWIPGLGLTSLDRNCLLNPTSWLTDSIIDAAQKLLKQISPVPGLESVACGLTMTFVVQPEEFVQILNTGHGHWVTVSTIGVAHPTVRVYDSLYSSAGTRLEAQISSLIQTEKPEISLEFMDVPIQAGTYDCGLFAVAFATALALGRRPEEFQFSQHEMRKHLYRCFERQKMEMFPFARKRRSKKSMVKSIQTVPVFCNCRMPEMGECMIECTMCLVL